jgi:FkbM family methyltransferase
MNPLVNYLRQMFSIHKKAVLWPINKLEDRGGHGISCRIRNLKIKLNGLKHKFGYDRSTSLYFVEEGSVRHYFGDKIRGFNLYSEGISHRTKILSESYHLNSVDFAQDDFVIDCGANYADLLLFLRSKIDEKNYISFEPGAEEFSAIVKNAPLSNNHNLGLGLDNAVHRLYINSRDADSSFIEPSQYTSTVDVKTITLSSFVFSNQIKKIKLLKLEAEGFEPEILQGAEDVINICEYVAIDGGNERGVGQEETFSYQSNFLITRGFEMIGVNLRWGRALFRNTRV